MKLNCKRMDLTYTPGEEIFNFPEESGLPFIFDVEEELTADSAAMDAVGEMLDEAERLAEKAKAAIKAALADEGSPDSSGKLNISSPGVYVKSMRLQFSFTEMPPHWFSRWGNRIGE